MKKMQDTAKTQGQPPTHSHLSSSYVPGLVVPHHVQDFLAGVRGADLGQPLHLLQVPVPIRLALEAPPGAFHRVLHPVHPAPCLVHLPERPRPNHAHHVKVRLEARDPSSSSSSSFSVAALSSSSSLPVPFPLMVVVVVVRGLADRGRDVHVVDAFVRGRGGKGHDVRRALVREVVAAVDGVATLELTPTATARPAAAHGGGRGPHRRAPRVVHGGGKGRGGGVRQVLVGRRRRLQLLVRVLHARVVAAPAVVVVRGVGTGRGRGPVVGRKGPHEAPWGRRARQDVVVAPVGLVPFLHLEGPVVVQVHHHGSLLGGGGGGCGLWCGCGAWGGVGSRRLCGRRCIILSFVFGGGLWGWTGQRPATPPLPPLCPPHWVCRGV